MRQEHKFCADFYHLVYDFIDHGKPVYFCLDGSAAQKGKREGVFEDETVPDIWLTLAGSSKPVLIEAKIIDDKGKIKFDRKSRQPEKWSSTGSGKHKPHLWIAASEDLSSFCWWEHAEIEGLLDRGPNAGGIMRAPSTRRTCEDIGTLAREIVRWAGSNGFRGEVP